MRIADRRRLETDTQNSLLVAEGESSVGKIINCENYCSFRRLVRVTARVLKFVMIVRELSGDDVKAAETLWLKGIQVALRNKPKYEHWRQEFGLVSDIKGVIRCGGRISKTEIKYETKHPIMLERNHRATRLIIEECHKRVYHNGVKKTLTEFRSKFWLVKGRQFIRKMIYGSITCRRLESQPYTPPGPPPLPKCKVTEDPPFSCTGIDFAGPHVQNRARSNAETAKVMVLFVYMRL